MDPPVLHGRGKLQEGGQGFMRPKGGRGHHGTEATTAAARSRWPRQGTVETSSSIHSEAEMYKMARQTRYYVQACKVKG